MPLPYNLTAVLLIVVWNSICAILLVYTGEIQIWLDYVFTGAVTSILGIIILRYLRNRAVRVIREFHGRLGRPKEVEALATKVFCSHYQLLTMVLFGLGGYLYMIYLLGSGLWKYSPVWWVLNLIYTTFIFHPLIGALFFFCIGVIFLIDSIGKNVSLTLDDLFLPDRTAGLRELGNVSLFNVFSWVIVQGVNWVGLVSWTLDPVILTSLIMYGMIAFIFFLAPLYSVHKKMKEMKREKTLEIGNNIIKTWNEIVEGKEKQFERVNVFFSFRKFFLGKIDEMQEWPFDLGLLVKIIGSASIPLLGYLVKVSSPLLGLHIP